MVSLNDEALPEKSNLEGRKCLLLLKTMISFKNLNLPYLFGYKTRFISLQNDYIKLVGWLVGFGFNGPLRQYFSLYRAVSHREREKEERKDRRE